MSICAHSGRDIERQVARATGESVREIHRRGFGLLQASGGHLDLDPEENRPSTIDWDEFYLLQPVRHFRKRKTPLVACS